MIKVLQRKINEKKYSFKTIITKKDLINFSKLSGDNNKIHIDKNTQLKKVLREI